MSTVDLHGSTAPRRRPAAGAVTVVVGLVLLVAALVVSISVGALDVSTGTIWRAVFSYDPSSDEAFAIREVRLPRIVLGALAGAALALSGAIMQATTRNPLADPGIMGLNAGAICFVVIALVAAPGIGQTELVFVSFAGAASAALMVFGIGVVSPGGLTPVRLALAGTAVSFLFTSLASGLALWKGLAQDVLFYTAGGLGGTEWSQVKVTAPFFVVGILGVLALSRQLTVLMLGDAVAAGLGQRTGPVKAAGWVLAVILAGAAVAVAGPIAFVGLMIPHITRAIVGVDFRWVIPCGALLGALLLVVADIGARMIAAPLETPVGFVTALIGVPFFLFLARTNRRMW